MQKKCYVIYLCHSTTDSKGSKTSAAQDYECVDNSMLTWLTVFQNHLSEHVHSSSLFVFEYRGEMRTSFGLLNFLHFLQNRKVFQKPWPFPKD